MHSGAKRISGNYRLGARGDGAGTPDPDVRGAAFLQKIFSAVQEKVVRSLVAPRAVPLGDRLELTQLLA